MLTDHCRLQLPSDLAHQSMGPCEDTVILSFNSGTLYTCNETTAAFLSAVDGRRTFGQILDRLEHTYDVPREKLHTDMTALVKHMVEEELLIVSER